MSNAIQGGADISIQECSEYGWRTYYQVYNAESSPFSLVAFAVSTNASPSVVIGTYRPGWSGRYVVKADWDNEFAAVGTFESFFGASAPGAAYFNHVLATGNVIAPNTYTYNQFYIEAAPLSEFVALADFGNGDRGVVAQSLPISPVPELPAFALMGAGLLALAGLRRRAN